MQYMSKCDATRKHASEELIEWLFQCLVQLLEAFPDVAGAVMMSSDSKQFLEQRAERDEIVAAVSCVCVVCVLACVCIKCRCVCACLHACLHVCIKCVYQVCVHTLCVYACMVGACAFLRIVWFE